MIPHPFIPGATFTVRHPFIRDTYTDMDAEGGWTVPCWRPGTIHAHRTYDCGEVYFAHGEGSQVLSVVSTHKPGKYPERIFYTRAWMDPDGKVFGKGKLRCATVQTFAGLVHGYRYPYEVVSPKEEAHA